VKKFPCFPLPSFYLVISVFPVPGWLGRSCLAPLTFPKVIPSRSAFFPYSLYPPFPLGPSPFPPFLLWLTRGAFRVFFCPVFFFSFSGNPFPPPPNQDLARVVQRPMSRLAVALFRLFLTKPLFASANPRAVLSLSGTHLDSRKQPRILINLSLPPFFFSFPRRASFFGGIGCPAPFPAISRAGPPFFFPIFFVFSIKACRPFVSGNLSSADFSPQISPPAFLDLPLF